MIDYKKARAKWKQKLTERQARFILAMADNGLRIYAATNELGIGETCGQYYRKKIKDGSEAVRAKAHDNAVHYLMYKKWYE